MEEGRPSITATFTAMLRAAHLLWDGPPKIFEDTFALRLSGCVSEATLRARFNRLDAEFAGSAGLDFTVGLRRHFTATAVMRSRYVEDRVEQRVRGAAEQKTGLRIHVTRH